MPVEEMDRVCNPQGHAAVDDLIRSDRFQQRRGCTRPPSRRLHSDSPGNRFRQYEIGDFKRSQAECQLLLRFQLEVTRASSTPHLSEFKRFGNKVTDSSARGTYYIEKRGMPVEEMECVCNPQGRAAVDDLIRSDRFQQRRGCMRPPSRRLHSDSPGNRFRQYRRSSSSGDRRGLAAVRAPLGSAFGD